jgi:predicted nuclease with TOPRIM domain
MRRRPAVVLSIVFTVITVAAIVVSFLADSKYKEAAAKIAEEKKYINELKSEAAEEKSQLDKEIEKMTVEQKEYEDQYETLKDANSKLERKVKKLYDHETLEEIRSYYYSTDGDEADSDIDPDSDYDADEDAADESEDAQTDGSAEASTVQDALDTTSAP